MCICSISILRINVCSRSSVALPDVYDAGTSTTPPPGQTGRSPVGHTHRLRAGHIGRPSMGQIGRLSLGQTGRSSVRRPRRSQTPCQAGLIGRLRLADPRAGRVTPADSDSLTLAERASPLIPDGSNRPPCCGSIPPTLDGSHWPIIPGSHRPTIPGQIAQSQVGHTGRLLVG